MKKPNKKAVALEYKKDLMKSPRVLAKGVNSYADQIVAVASKKSIPVITNAILAENLTQLELEEEIPEELFLSVATVLSWAFWIKGKMP